MTLCVITPVYNGSKYIRETVVSVLAAIDGRPIEFIVVDDGSTDETAAILSEFIGKIDYVYQDNQGESAAVNSGLLKSSADYVLVVSADDPLFTPSIFSGVDDFFMSNPNTVAWYPNWRMIDEHGDIIREVQVEEYLERRLVCQFQCLPGPGTFFRKRTALQVGGRRSRWRFVGDYDFWLRLSKHGDFQKRDETLAQWRLHSSSTSVRQLGVEMFTERIEVIRSHLNEYPIPVDEQREALAHAYYFAALLSYQTKGIPGRRALLKSILIARGLVSEFNWLSAFFVCVAPVSRYFKSAIDSSRGLRREEE